MSPSAQGAFGAKIVVPASAAHPVPDEMPDPHAAGILVTYQTAYFALIRRAARIVRNPESLAQGREPIARADPID